MLGELALAIPSVGALLLLWPWAQTPDSCPFDPNPDLGSSSRAWLGMGTWLPFIGGQLGLGPWIPNKHGSLSAV